MHEWDDENSGDDVEVKLEFGFWLAVAMVNMGCLVFWWLS